MTEKGVFAVYMSLLEKQHIEAFAQSQNMSASALVCKVMAEYTGYDLVAEKQNSTEKRGRPRKYATEEEAREAARKRTQQRDDLTRRLLEDHQAQQRRKDAQKLEDSLRRRGAL